MDITVVGSVALDTVETPWGRNENGLGGAAVYFSLAAIPFAPVHLVGVVGEDFPVEHVKLLSGKGINLEGLERVPGRTFRWSGRYHEDVNLRDTLDTQLNVFEQFHPKLPETARKSEILFLGNIHPGLQLEVLDQSAHQFSALDTMNLWIEITQEDLRRVLARVNCLIINDGEAKQLTGEANVVRAAKDILKMGPNAVVVKKGEHGAMLFCRDAEVFATPALPLENVVDPTGAGDSFAGGFLGYLAYTGATDPASLRRAVLRGTAVASFTCQDFGPRALATATHDAIEARVADFRRVTEA